MQAVLAFMLQTAQKGLDDLAAREAAVARRLAESRDAIDGAHRQEESFAARANELAQREVEVAKREYAMREAQKALDARAAQLTEHEKSLAARLEQVKVLLS